MGFGADADATAAETDAAAELLTRHLESVSKGVVRSSNGPKKEKQQ